MRNNCQVLVSVCGTSTRLYGSFVLISFSLHFPCIFLAFFLHFSRDNESVTFVLSNETRVGFIEVPGTVHNSLKQLHSYIMFSCLEWTEEENGTKKNVND